MEVNYFGPLLVGNVFLPLLRRNPRSLVIFISSIAGRVPIPFQSHYSSSKYALEAYAACLKMEARSFGVECVLVEPGDIQTGFTAHREFPHLHDSIYADMAGRAVRRMEEDERNGMRPEAVASVVLKMAHRRHPPLRTAVGLQYKALMVLARIFPDRLVLFILRKMYRA